MATYTSNLNLKKPALDDDALITDINNNMDILDAAANGIEDALAIVATGNTHAAITSGQFVYVRNHSTLTEGLYVASSNIAANATLSSSNLAADSKGGLNALSEQIALYDFGNSTIDINTSLKTLGDSMSNKTTKTIYFVAPNNFAPFAQTVYMGTIQRNESGRYNVLVLGFAAASLIVGNYKNNEWTWKAATLT